jgi:PIN domain nuclease of toxin-antitoxin system
LNLLLDTCALSWWLDNPSRLSAEARKAIAEGRNQVWVSAAVVWEIEIKKARGKLRAPDNIEEVLEEERFVPLPITIPHVLALAGLPSIHEDPFDRIQAAQAKLEGLTIVTRDKALKEYGVPFISA